MKVRIYKNLPRGSAHRRRWSYGKLPGRQHLFWVGPFFITAVGRQPK